MIVILSIIDYVQPFLFLIRRNECNRYQYQRNLMTVVNVNMQFRYLFESSDIEYH